MLFVEHFKISPTVHSDTNSMSHTADNASETSSTKATSARTGKDLILATKPFAKEDTRRSWWVVLSTLAMLVLALIGTLITWALPVRVIFSLLSGLLMVRVFVIYHDHQHHAILSRSRAADILMSVVGLIALAPSSIWKSSHNHHHHHNSKLRGSHIGSYPIMTRERFASSSRRQQIEYLFIRHPATIFAGYVTTFMLGMCLLPFLRNPAKHWDGIVSLLIHAAIAVALFAFGGWTALLLAMVFPYSLASGLGSYMFYAQHNFPQVTHTDNSGWTHEGAALQSSSYMKLPRLMHWFTANIGYHHVHHLNAKIPFYRLPETMQAMPELQAPRTTSLHPGEIIRCLHVKVWDTERKCMTGL